MEEHIYTCIYMEEGYIYVYMEEHIYIRVYIWRRGIYMYIWRSIYIYVYIYGGGVYMYMEEGYYIYGGGLYMYIYLEDGYIYIWGISVSLPWCLSAWIDSAAASNHRLLFAALLF